VLPCSERMDQREKEQRDRVQWEKVQRNFEGFLSNIRNNIQSPGVHSLVVCPLTDLRMMGARLDVEALRVMLQGLEEETRDKSYDSHVTWCINEAKASLIRHIQFEESRNVALD